MSTKGHIRRDTYTKHHHNENKKKCTKKDVAQNYEIEENLDVVIKRKLFEV